MPRIVNLEGKRHSFPDDVTDEEISSALNEGFAPPKAAPPAPSRNVQQMFAPTEKDIPEGMPGQGGEAGVKLLQSTKAAIPATRASFKGVQEMDLENRLQNEGNFLPEGGGGAVDAVQTVAKKLESSLFPEKPSVKEIKKSQHLQELKGDFEEVKAKRKELQGEAEALRPDTEGMSAFARGITNAPESLVPQLAMLPISIATKNPAPNLAAAGLLTQGAAYTDSRDAGTSVGNSQANANLQAGVEILTELPAMKVLSSIGGKGLKETLTKFIKFDVLGEQVATGGQDLTDWALNKRNEGKSGWDYLAERPEAAMETLGTTLLSSGVMATAAIPFSGESKQSKDFRKLAASVEMYQEVKDSGKDAEAEAIKEDVVDLAEEKAEEIRKGTDELSGGLNNNKPTEEFNTESFLTPDRELDISNLEPLSEEGETALVSTPKLSSSLTVEDMNDGDSSQGIDSLFDTDLQVGNSNKVIDNAAPYEPNVNDEVARSERKILFGPQSQLGHKIGEVRTDKSTYVIGEATNDRDSSVLQGAHELVESMRAQFMPEATVILSNETLPTRGAIGLHAQLDSGEHLIIPAFARSFSGKDKSKLGAGNFNTSTQAKIVDNIHHEFAHALVTERFFEGVSKKTRAAFNREQRTGVISAQTILNLPNEQAKLAMEFNKFRKAIKTENAAWFQSEWMSPALALEKQLIHRNGGTPSESAYKFVRRLVLRRNPEYAALVQRQKLAVTAEQKQAVGQEMLEYGDAAVAEYLSFQEFMAEKGARNAFETGRTEKSSLGSEEMFGKGIARLKREEEFRTSALTGTDSFISGLTQLLRDFFAALKKGIKLANGQVYRIQAGTSYQDWLNQLSRTSNLVDEGKKPIRGQRSGKVKKKAETKKDLGLPEYAKEAKVVRRRITRGRFSPKEKQELYKLTREGAYNTVHERMVEILGKRVHKQLDVSEEFDLEFSGLTEEDSINPLIRKNALAEWFKLGFESRFFKSWFGDWQANEGEASAVVAADGTPLVVYHATDGSIKGVGVGGSSAFAEFNRGDVGFHFGSLTAAHARLFKTTPTSYEDTAQKDVNSRQAAYETLYEANARNPSTVKEEKLRPNDWYLMRTVLNVRNPVELDEGTRTTMWNFPDVMLEVLRDSGYINEQERAATVELLREELGSLDASVLNEIDGRVKFNRVKELLEAKGYDGIKYTNRVESGTSWVVFNSNQVKTLNGTFSKSKKIHLQKDVDVSNPTGLELDNVAYVAEKYQGMGLTGRAIRRLARAQWYIMQLQQLAWVHPEYHFLQSADVAASAYNAAKSAMQQKGEDIAQRWSKLGKENDSKLSKILEDESTEGVHWTEWGTNDKGRPAHVFGESALAEFTKRGIDVNDSGGVAQLYLESKNALLSQLTEAHLILARNVGKTVEDPIEYSLKLNELKKKYKELREIPLLPRGDYGDWTVVVEDVVEGTKKIVASYAFEQEWQIATARKAISKRFPNATITSSNSKLSDEHKPLLGIPREYADVAAQALGLSEAQHELLSSLMSPIKQEKAFLPYQRALDKAAGGSSDRGRNFANFIWHNSTMLAKLEARPAFNASLQEATQMERDINERAMDEEVRQRMLSDLSRAKHFLKTTIDYSLSPPNEWYTARSAIALTYLWGGVKTAALNVMSLLFSGSQLSTDYGDIIGAKALAKAHEQLQALLRGAEVDADISRLYSKALEEGFIDQSYSSHLAGAATSGTLKRMGKKSRTARKVDNTLKSVASAGMLPFTLTEQYTRRVTFLAEVNAEVMKARAAGKKINDISVYENAVKKTNITQNSYSLANRPRIMRGGSGAGNLLPLATIFMSFLGHFGFQALGGYELGQNRQAKVNGLDAPKSAVGHSFRVLAVVFVLAGYEGLPGMENILDFLDWVSRKFTGVTMRQTIRESIQTLPDVGDAGMSNDPTLWSQGFAHDVWGFNVSKSLGLGRIIPGTDVFSNNVNSGSDLLGDTIPSLLGVTGGVLKWGLDVGVDASNGKDLTRNLMRAPGFVGSVASAAEWQDKGEVQGTYGEKVYEPSTKEIVGKALGFNPTGLSEKREITWAKREAGNYWMKRRSNLQAQFNRARDQRDREGVADVMKAVKTLNRIAPSRELKMTRGEMNKGFARFRKEQRRREKGVTTGRLKRLERQVESSFDEGEQ